MTDAGDVDLAIFKVLYSMPLRDREYFTVRVNPDLGTIVWPTGQTSLRRR